MGNLVDLKTMIKFYREQINNDLQLLTDDLLTRYRAMGDKFSVTEEDQFVDSQSLSTIKWKEYNVFQFHLPEIRALYRAISSMTRQACLDLSIDFEEQNYMLQGWFNVNYKDSGHLSWHDHGVPGANSFHGYYCVKAEPSTTTYKNSTNFVVITNQNNVALLSEIGNSHKQDPWDWEGPRITIAYDVVPLARLIDNTHKEETENHWVPLA